jgi:hypothetical protein
LSYIGKGRRLAAAVSVALIAGAATSVLAGATGHGGEAGSPVQAWGDNTYGEIGNGSRTAEPVRSPVSVEGLSCAVAAAIYRLSTRVRGTTTSTKLFSTFSLPEPVGFVS